MAEEVKEASEYLDVLGDVQVDKFYAGQEQMQKLIGKQLIIRSIYDRTSAYETGDGSFLTVVASMGKKTIGFNTGSQILMRQLRALEEHFPIKTKIANKVAHSKYTYQTLE